MADKSQISWTDATWSPIVGCSRKSEGCRNCYSERLVATRLRHTEKYSGLAQMTQAGPRWTNVVRCLDTELRKPLGWKKPRRIFVNSMSDTFHEDVPFEFLDKVFAIMALCPQHTFQVLTKRPERAAEWFSSSPIDRLRPIAERQLCLWGGPVITNRWAQYVESHKAMFDHCLHAWPLSNVWVGTSVENQATADERIPHLLRVPAAVRFLSCEPLLGPVDLLKNGDPLCRCDGCLAMATPFDPDVPGLQRIDWVITGGESGPNARPLNADWVRSLRDQCAAAGVAYHHKQNGEWAPGEIAGSFGSFRTVDAVWWMNGEEWYRRRVTPSEEFLEGEEPGAYRIGRKAAGRLLDAATHDAFPEVVR